MRQTAQLLLNYVSVSNPQVSKRQEIDFYLANTEVYKEVVDKLPKEERIDTDGNPLPEAKIYQYAVDSIDPAKLGYTEEEKKPSISSAKWMRLKTLPVLRLWPIRCP